MPVVLQGTLVGSHDRSKNATICLLFGSEMTKDPIQGDTWQTKILWRHVAHWRRHAKPQWLTYLGDQGALLSCGWCSRQ
jgi:hypothetical protein